MNARKWFFDLAKIMTTSKTINIPHEVAEQIAQFNNQTQVIERLKAELAEQKSKTSKYAEYLFTVLDGEPAWETNFCDVCGIQCSYGELEYCSSRNCGRDLDPIHGKNLSVCEDCAVEYFAVLGDDVDPMCWDCYNGETKIPRIDRLTDAYAKREKRKRKEILDRKIEILKRIIPTCSEEQVSHYAAKKNGRWFLYGIGSCAPLMERTSWEIQYISSNPKDY